MWLGRSWLPVNGSRSGWRGEAHRFRQFLFLFFYEDEIMYAKQKLLTVAAVAAAFVFAFTSTMARADWSTTEPAKYVQLPDVETGMDVNATWLVGPDVPPQPIFPFVKLLADDWAGCADSTKTATNKTTGRLGRRG
jgi:hypothetical protein